MIEPHGASSVVPSARLELLAGTLYSRNLKVSYLESRRGVDDYSEFFKGLVFLFFTMV